MRLLLQMPHTPPLHHACEPLALRHTHHIQHFVWLEHLVHTHFLFKQVVHILHLVIHGPTVDLDLKDVVLVLSEVLHEVHLSVADGADHCAVLGDAVQLLLDEFGVLGCLAVVVVEGFFVLGFDPVLIESLEGAFVEMGGPNSGQSTQSARGLGVAHYSHYLQRGGLDHCHCLHLFLLVEECLRSVYFSQHVGHAGLEPTERGEVAGLLRVIAGEGSDLPAMVAGALARQVAQVSFSGAAVFAVRHQLFTISYLISIIQYYQYIPCTHLCECDTKINLNCMMNRNTYQDGRKPVSRNNSVQRLTMATNPLSVSHPKQTTQNERNEKMTRTILNALQRGVTQNHRYSSSNTIKPNQKGLISTISSLLHAIDGHFESSNLQIDTIIDLFKMLGYPSNISKTIFQPVGAPHSWPVCLQMLEWLAQLSEFHHIAQTQIDENHTQQDLNDKIVESFIEGKPQIVTEFLASRIQGVEEEISQLKYNIETKRLAMRNLDASQMDVKDLQVELQKQKEVHMRVKEEAIEVERRKAKKEREVAEKTKRNQEQEEYKLRLDKKINALKYQIQHQEMSVDQIQKTKQEIRHLRDKIIRKRNQYEAEMSKTKREFEKQLQDFRNYKNTISDISEELGKKQRLRALCLELPVLDEMKLVDYFNDLTTEGSERETNEILGETPLYNFVTAQDRMQIALEAELRDILRRNETLLKSKNHFQNLQKDSKRKIGELSGLLEETRKNAERLKGELTSKQNSAQNFSEQVIRRTQQLNQSALEEEILLRENQSLIHKWQQNTILYKQYEQEAIDYVEAARKRLLDFESGAIELILKKRVNIEDLCQRMAEQ